MQTTSFENITTISFYLYSFPAILLPNPEIIIIGISRAIFIPAEKTIQYKIGDRTLPIKVLQYGELKDIICINLHDNEEASLQAARSVLESSGGTLIKIENNNQRVIRSG